MPGTAYALAGPPASLSFTELRTLLNLDRARAGLPPLTYKQARTFVEAYGIRFLQGKGKGCKLLIAGEDLHRSRLWAALQRRAQDAQDEAEEGED